uniref:poly(ADP-ribose) glycohydrolase n=1 Tax=Alexandrium catenella TaxID=2925 RepID=A0A7S1WGI5_ALECA
MEAEPQAQGPTFTSEAASEDSHHGSPRPLVLFFHDHDEALWGRVTESLGSFAQQCEAGEVTDADGLLKRLKEIRLQTRTRGELKAFAKAVAAAPEKGICELKVLLEKVMPFAARLVSGIQALFPDGLRYLVQKTSGQVFLTRRQCAALIAGSLFGAIPNPELQCKVQPKRLEAPGFDWSFVLDAEVTKCLCLLCYLAQLADATSDFLEEVVSFARRVLVPIQLEEWRKCDKPLSRASVNSGTIEDSHGNLQADFANEYLGGGVLQGGNVQEEIRFSVCPECCVGMLFCEKMLWYEAIFIVGAQQFSKYSGYGGSFRFGGPFKEVYRGPKDGRGRVGPHIVAFDALVFPGKTQYEEPRILRELVKAHAASLGDLAEDAGERCRCFATGNWGCGVFGGDPQLKALIQWLAASVAGRDIEYYPFGDERVADLAQVFDAIQKSGARCSDLFALLTQGHKAGCVFDAVLESLRLRREAQEAHGVHEAS